MESIFIFASESNPIYQHHFQKIHKNVNQEGILELHKTRKSNLIVVRTKKCFIISHKEGAIRFTIHSSKFNINTVMENLRKFIKTVFSLFKKMDDLVFLEYPVEITEIITMICDGGHPYLVHTFHALTLFRRVFYKNSVTEAISMNMKVQMEPNCPIGFSNLEKKFESSFSSGETIDVKTTEKLYTVIDRNQRVLHSSVQGYTSVDNQITDMDRFALIMTKPMNFEDIGYHAFAQPSNEIVPTKIAFPCIKAKSVIYSYYTSNISQITHPFSAKLNILKIDGNLCNFYIQFYSTGFKNQHRRPSIIFLKLIVPLPDNTKVKKLSANQGEVSVSENGLYLSWNLDEVDIREKIELSCCVEMPEHRIINRPVFCLKASFRLTKFTPTGILPKATRFITQKKVFPFLDYYKNITTSNSYKILL